MLMKYLTLPILILNLLGLSPISHAVDNEHVSPWPELKKQYFAGKTIRPQATDLLFLDIPDQIEDASVIPVKIQSLAAQTSSNHIQTIYLIVDQNPQPYAAVFHLSPDLGAVWLSTRIRIDNFSHVRVIAEMNDGSLHMVKKFVAASGGCSAPVSKGSITTRYKPGKIQIRMRKAITGQQHSVQVIIRHPNHNGLQFDPATRQYIPPHYVTNINISYHNKPLIQAKTGITLSENPSIRFNFIPETTAKLKVEIIDSKKNVFTAEKTVTVR